MFIFHTIKNKGSSLIETVIYITIFTMLAMSVTSALYSLAGSYALIQSSVAIETVGETALEKMAREARNSLSIDTAASTFNTSPGTLRLNTTDDSGNPLTVEFFLSGGIVRVREGGVDIGPLSSSKATITSLIFQLIVTDNSEAVRITMTLESGQGKSFKTRTFYATAVIRGSYAP